MARQKNTGKPANAKKREARSRAEAQRAEKPKPRGFRPRPGGLAHAPDVEKSGPPPRSFKKRALATGLTPRFSAPVMLSMPEFGDYALIDSGFERKLERYGPYTIVRPEGQALWQPHLPEEEWTKADAVFAGSDDEDANGRWRFANRLANAHQEDVWPLNYNGLTFHARFTAFRHMGFFPEQAAHWAWFSKLITRERQRSETRPVTVLNLFGYTGIASLIAARGGAEVTHIDASKKAIGWARENQRLSGLSEVPIRWIAEDALKFVEREARRGRTYDGIIMDPPKYGRGPNGETWQYFDQIADLMHGARAILNDNPLFFILSSYAIRASFYATHELARDVFSGLGGHIESGELLLHEEGRERALSTSLFTRWSRGENDD